MLKLKPFPYQNDGIEYGVKNKRIILGDEPGLGKAQPIDSLICTPFGWKTMGELKIGDKVSTPDGEISTVNGVFPQGLRPIYRVIFNDNSFTECDLEHLWTVRDENRRKRGTGWITKSLGEIIKSGLTLKPSMKRLEGSRKPVLKWEIPQTCPVSFDSKELVIPPYVMGVLIGDGYLGGREVCFSNPDFDIDIRKKVESLLPDNFKLKINNKPACPQISITQNRTTKKNPWLNEIKELGLNVKSALRFIPHKYLFNDVEKRKELLRGLFDTDGSCIKNRTNFHTVSRKLAEDVQTLVQSLGGLARINVYDRTKEGKSVEYQVSINIGFCPFALQRKAINWRPRAFRRYISSVEYVGEKEAKCIKVDHPSHLYITDSFIVTHNTGQSIGIVTKENAFPCLVICPATLKLNWQREWHLWTDRKAMILNDANRHSWWMFAKPELNPFGTGASVDVFIVNYESLKKFFVADIPRGELKLKDIRFQPQISIFKSIIIDEAHRLKDPGTQQSKFAKGIVTGKDLILALTGTPIVNSQEDLVSVLGILDRLKDFGGASMFRAKWLDKSKLPELGEKLRETCFIRRRKSEVLKDLPAKMRSIFPTELTNQQEYDHALNDLKSYLIEYKQKTNAEAARLLRMKALVQVGILKGISARGKLTAIIDYVNEIQKAGEKVILFCHLREIGEALKEAFPDACVIKGGMPAHLKQANVDRFQNDPDAKVIICSIKAAGVGLTLTASSRVAFAELPWHPADLEQCEDRCIVEGEPVLTPDGWKPIEQIKKGDLVINMYGQPSIVRDAWSKQNTKLITEFQVEGWGVIKTTNDHRILTREGWKEACRLLPGDKVMMPRQMEDPQRLESVLFDDDCRIKSWFIGSRGQIIPNGRLIKAPERVILTSETLFVFGYFVGDGFASTLTSKGRFISVSGHVVKKRKALERCKKWFKSIGLKTNEQQGDNCLEIRAYSGEWALFFEKHFGIKAQGKQLPEFLMQLNEVQSQELLNGLMASDGYYRKGRFEYITASHKLASQVSRLILRAGFRPTVGRNTTGHHSVAYSVSQRDNYALVQSVLTYFPKRVNGFRQRVYDLTTDDSESFVLGLSIVHNCHRIGQKDSVQCLYFLGKDSIDNHIYRIIDRKRETANLVTGDRNEIEVKIQNELFEELLRTM